MRRSSLLPQQLSQLGKVHRHPPGPVAGKQLGRRAPSRLILEIDIGQRLPVVVADDEAGVRPLDGPGRREAAGRRFHLLVERRSSFTRRMA